MENHRAVSGIAYDLNCARFALFDVPDQPGIAKLLFKSLADENINVDIIIQSAMRDGRNDIAFTIEEDELIRAIPIMEGLVKQISASGMTYGKEIAKVSIVGAAMQSNIGIAAAMFEALADEGINIHMISTSEIRISCIIDECDIETAVKALHHKFDLDKIK